MAAAAVGALWMAWTGEAPPDDLRQPPPYFTNTVSQVHKQATDDYYVAISARNTNGMAREMVSQVVVTDQTLDPRHDAILNDNVDPYPYASPQGPQAEITFVGTGLDKSDVTQPLFVAVWLHYTDARNSQACTQSNYYAFPGLKPTGNMRWRLRMAQPEEAQRIEAYLTEQDRLLFALPAKDCLS